MAKDRISYSQCWEDTDVLLSVLALGPDDTVLSITSGGDNTLALLCQGVKKVVSVDISAAQNHLLELKHAAALSLAYDEYLAFLGVYHSRDRLATFARLAPRLSAEARTWWLKHRKFIAQGVIHAGRFERFTVGFARYVLPLIHSRALIEELRSSSDTDTQLTLYRERWDTPLWRFMFGTATSRLMLARVRHGAMFAQTHPQDLSRTYRDRLEQLLARVPALGNYYLEYSLTGSFGGDLPLYLTREGHAALRDSKTELEIVSGDLLSVLKKAPDQSFSAYNLSDVFEAFSEEGHEAMWVEIVRTARPGARVAFWNNLVSRDVPRPVSERVRKEGASYASKDRVFFYGSFSAYTIYS